VPPPLDVQPEEDGWTRTVTLYRQLLVEVGAETSAAPWLSEAVAEIEATIGEIRDLRKQLEETAAKATEQQEDVRKPREQIGHALDELSKDDSRIGGQIAEIIELLEPGEQRLDAAMHAVLSGLSGAPRTMRVGEPVSERDAAALAELVRAGSELSLSRDMASELRSRLGRKKAERRDLRFQMVQLKQKLDQLNQTRTVDMEIWHEDAHRLSAAIQVKLESIAPTARRISSHLQRFPGVRDRLGAGHAPITLS
jgi:predicted  nucleic acid-binding Zn-ribbon protein